MNLPILFQAILKNPLKIKLTLLLILFALFFISLQTITGCAPSKRFTSDDDKSKEKNDNSSSGKELNHINKFDEVATTEIRVLLNEYTSAYQFLVESSLELFIANSKMAVINKGNKIHINAISNNLQLNVLNKTFESNQFILVPNDVNGIIKIDNKNYRGKIIINSFNGNLRIINQISLEDYVKGVMTKEMPLGRDLEHYEALKAFAICARTYAYTKIFESKSHYDILPDTRDQVYGGVDAETEYSNRVVDETRNLILTYENKPAVVFYHSTCGGTTEDAENVFTKVSVPYLRSVKDGLSPHCIISPRYEWTEIIPEYKVVDRLLRAGLISGKNFKVKDIIVNSRFESGRINELEIILTGNGKEQKVKLYGNNIRSVIRTADDNSILRSNSFDIRFSSDRTIIIIGKGNGHGVGMCQWGAIGMSRNGINHKEILDHYYPGTNIQELK